MKRSGMRDGRPGLRCAYPGYGLRLRINLLLSGGMR